MRTWFEVRQLVRSIKSNRLEMVYHSTVERLALQTYERFKVDFPGEYFEVVKVEHNETCYGHNGTPVTAPND